LIWSSSVVTDPASKPVSDGNVRAGRRTLPIRVIGWTVAAATVLTAAIVFVALTRARPGYDAFGWLVWGRQTLHWNLNTDGAPSWKPLTFLFTLPYGLVKGAQQYLWVLTAVAGAFAGAGFAGRIAYRLSRRSPERRLGPVVAAIIAGVGVLGIDGYAHQLLIANADPMTATFCLAAIDSHMSKRPRLAFTMLVLVALGRPEAWLFAALYGIWVWRSVPSSRWLVVAGLALIPAIWFTIPALTSKSWLTPGDLDLNSVNAIHGSRFTGVIDRFVDLHDWPMELAALVAVGVAAWRRDRVTLTLAAAVVGWVAIEIVLALKGYSAVPRYLFEPAAVMVVLAASAAGLALGWVPARAPWLRWLSVVALIVFAAALYPYLHQEAKTARDQVSQQKGFAKQLDRLSAVIAKVGGPGRILACGQPVTLVQFQSTVAWEVGLNVGNVGFRPGRSIHKGIPVVVLKPHDQGWQIRTYNIPGAKAAACERLRTDSAFG
jgi:hypothetical protein